MAQTAQPMEVHTASRRVTVYNECRVISWPASTPTMVDGFTDLDIHGLLPPRYPDHQPWLGQGLSNHAIRSGLGERQPQPPAIPDTVQPGHGERVSAGGLGSGEHCDDRARGKIDRRSAGGRALISGMLGPEGAERPGIPQHDLPGRLDRTA